MDHFRQRQILHHRLSFLPRHLLIPSVCQWIPLFHAECQSYRMLLLIWSGSCYSLPAGPTTLQVFRITHPSAS
jgi:hypothetical protein